ncbi:MAG: lamin tail domain-containing protein [Bacteroidales bacterium]|nr:lamin tail domain-containing protein [Bacteroidales bacterium]
MKKFFVFAAAAAFALVACTKDDTNKVDGSNNNDSKEVAGLVLNELDGQNKFIELYNTTDKEISLEGVNIVKYDSSKEGGKSTTWVGAKDMKIAAKAWVVLESSDLKDPAEKGDPNYVYESENHIFKGGLSPKKNVKIELYDATGKLLDEFVRGTEGAGWNQVKGYAENEDCSFSRVPDGTGKFVYAAPTKKAANGAKVADIEQAPEM